VLGHGAGRRGVVDMAVRQQDLGDLDALLVDRLLQHVEIAAGSTAVPSMVSWHQTMEQFCWNGVTGAIMTLIMEPM
jgi:hypothetical protein